MAGAEAEAGPNREGDVRELRQEEPREHDGAAPGDHLPPEHQSEPDKDVPGDGRPPRPIRNRPVSRRLKEIHYVRDGVDEIEYEELPLLSDRELDWLENRVPFV